MEGMVSNEPPLRDKVALVFGGSRGIGAAIVKQLAADGASDALTYAKSPDKAAESVRAAEDMRKCCVIRCGPNASLIDATGPLVNIFHGIRL